MQAPIVDREDSAATLQRWIVPVAFVTGIVFIIGIIALVVAFPHPTDRQFIVFRSVLALAGSAFAIGLTGFISIRLSLPGGGWITGVFGKSCGWKPARR